MLCDICHTREAKIMYTEIINGQKREQHLCETCAGEQTLALTGKIGGEISIGSILSGILQNYAKGLVAKSSNEPVCQRCGMTASNLIKDGRVGCPECYNAFSMILAKNLKTVQGAVEHHGKVPVNADKIEVNPVSLTGRTAVDVVNEAADEIARKNSRIGRKSASSKSSKARQIQITSDSDDEIKEYRNRLKKAREAEDYEEAARLRDLIRDAEGTAGKQVKEKAKKTASCAKKTAGKAEKATGGSAKGSSRGRKSTGRSSSPAKGGKT